MFDRHAERPFIEVEGVRFHPENPLGNHVPDATWEHFALNEMIDFYYAAMETEPSATEIVIAACKRQIAISRRVAASCVRRFPGQMLPRHIGYERLFLSLERLGRFEEAIGVAMTAKRSRWAPNSATWTSRINRCKAKLRIHRGN